MYVCVCVHECVRARAFLCVYMHVCARAYVCARDCTSAYSVVTPPAVCVP